MAVDDLLAYPVLVLVGAGLGALGVAWPAYELGRRRGREEAPELPDDLLLEVRRQSIAVAREHGPMGPDGRRGPRRERGPGRETRW